MRQLKSQEQLSDFLVISKLFSLYAKHNKSSIISCAATAIVCGIRPYVLVVLSGLVIDSLTAGLAVQTLFLYLGAGLLLNMLLAALEAWLREKFNSSVENCMERQNRDMNERSMEIDYENLENPQIQEKKRKQEQVVNINGGIYWMLIWPLDKGLTGLVSIITALVVAAPLFLENGDGGSLKYIALSAGMLAIIALCVWASYRNNRYWSVKAKVYFEKYAACNRVSNYILHNILSGNETGKDLRIFKQQELIKKGVLGQEEKASGFLKRIRTLKMTENGVEATMAMISCGAVYFYAALKAYLGLITIGSVVRCASAIIQCVDGLKYVLFGVSGFREAAGYGRDYLDYIEFKDEKASGTSSTSSDKQQEIELECRNVSFRYPGSKEDVIKDMNLKLKLMPGKRFAIVGKNGSGKTTFIKLLCRLYDVSEGSIYLNGKDIREYDYQEYLDMFAVVFQDYRVFSLKLGENIAGSEQVDEGRAEDALNKSGFAQRFAGMSRGFDTYIGKDFDESGVNVSGGERQKLAIARAIYKNAPLVIMDEPTAALDPISECDIYEGFDRLVGKKTAIYISHRLASCRFCDNILVFENGKVSQNGSHDTLVEEEGLYRKLWNAQAQYYNV